MEKPCDSRHLLSVLARVVQARATGRELARLRVIAITKTDPCEAIQPGRFRADLFYRPAGAEIATPPLRQTDGDIVRLYTHVFARAADRKGRPVPKVDFTLRCDLARRP